MGHQYRAFMMSPVIVAVLLATLTTVSAQGDSTTTTSTTTNTTTTTNSTATTPTTTTATTITTDPNSTNSAPTTNSTTGTTPSTATSKTSTVPPPIGKLRPVTDGCLRIYLQCTSTTAEYLAANFCQASTTQKNCFNDPLNCTAVETSRITYVDCGPNILGANKTLGTFCQGRITECLSLSDKPENINPTTDFKSFFCAKKNEKCLLTANDKAVCTADEYKAAVKVAGCTAAHTVVSSALFISLAVLTQRFLYRC